MLYSLQIAKLNNASFALTSGFRADRVGQLLHQRGRQEWFIGTRAKARRTVKLCFRRHLLPMGRAGETATGIRRRAHRRGQESLRHGSGPQQPEAATHRPITSGRPEEALEQHVKYLLRELKVCEGCGGLWVRTGAEAGVYCRTCSALVADLPGRRRRSPGRPCKVHNAGCARLEVVAAGAAVEQTRAMRGRCVHGQEVDEQRMEELAVERRAGMSLVKPPESPEPDPAYDEAVGEDRAPSTGSDSGGVHTMRKRVSRAVPAEAFVVTAKVGGAR